MRPVAILCLWCIVWAPITAWAEDVENAERSEDAKELDAPEDAEGSGDSLSTAHQAFEEGKSLYQAGEFVAASEKFREANRLRPTWKLYFNIGQCEAAAKRNGLAVEAFEMYLSLGGDDIPVDRHDLVVSEIKRLRPIVGYVNVLAEPDAEVIIDGNERGKTPLPGPLMVSAGTDHTIRIDRAGEVLHERKVRVAGQQTVTVDIAKEASLEPETATAGVALSQYSKLKEECPEKQCPSTSEKDLGDRADGLALATDILIPVGAVIGTVGIILLVVSRRRGESQNRVALRPVLGPEQGGLLLEGRF